VNTTNTFPSFHRLLTVVKNDLLCFFSVLPTPSAKCCHTLGCVHE
jgi:hypothetical protein